MTYPEIWEIVIELPTGDHRPAFEASIEAFVTGHAIFEVEGTPRWRLTGYTEGPPDEAAVAASVSAAAAAAGVSAPDISFAPVIEKDWVAESEKSLTPIHVPPYYVFGSHICDTPPANAIAIQIDAGLAFGTGNHETTQGCLLALEAVLADQPPKSPIDIGTGSGLLAIAVAKRFDVDVMASDIDPIAIDVARENAVINGVEDRISFAVSDGLDDARIMASAPYDLILANIVANPLIALAPGISSIAEAGGHVVLSGILLEQADSVIAAYRDGGLTLKKRIDLGNWTTLILTNPAS
ncbi:MAG: ribosomal protein L11 methyltransferase [Paracoccaceae bacterium]|jgi:ribosomal protein L11 methyltransferase